MQAHKYFYLIIYLMMTHTSTQAQDTPSLAERLGYTSDAKLLMIHADDIAVSHTENQASFQAMAKGSVNSGSIMVPCPWLSGSKLIMSKQNPDLGLWVYILHLTAEWKHYKWGPVLGKDIMYLVWLMKQVIFMIM